MDKYQEFALKNTRYVVYEDESLKKSVSGDKWISVADGIVVNQKEDYNITKYFIRFDGATIKSITFNGKTYEIQNVENSSHPSCVIPVDFNNKIPEITINYNVIDPVKVEIKYIDADKKAFDDKVAKENQDKLAEKAQIKISTGADLVNIYFQPCCDDCEKTVIELYLAEGQFSKCDWRGNQYGFVPQLLGGTIKQLMGKFKVDDGMMFKSINGLARGVYGYRVSQFNGKGECLFTTDYSFFQIK